MSVDADRVDATVELHAGSTVVFYSDGLVEHRRSDYQTGLDRLQAVLADTAGMTPEQICDTVLTAMVPPDA
jgi:serine phosphatase RsbU (regulator of sigma subunit)